MDRLQLDIITPERSLLSEAVDAVTLPGLGGELGILPGHTPLISQLQTGLLSFTQGGTTRRLHVSGGFVEVSGERVAVLAELAERPEEIDAARARTQRDQAEKLLNAATSSDDEMVRARTQFDRSVARLQLVEAK
ncbi:MAG: F0F1 ATP synthase subunit epsilon [Pyrinomonadaceae bacterium]